MSSVTKWRWNGSVVFYVASTDSAWIGLTAPRKWAPASSALCLGSPSASSPLCSRLSEAPLLLTLASPFFFHLTILLFHWMDFLTPPHSSNKNIHLHSSQTIELQNDLKETAIEKKKKKKKELRELLRFHWFLGNVTLGKEVLLMHIKDFFHCQSF